jgi:hypothetical protein
LVAEAQRASDEIGRCASLGQAQTRASRRGNIERINGCRQGLEAVGGVPTIALVEPEARKLRCRTTAATAMKRSSSTPMPRGCAKPLKSSPTTSAWGKNHKGSAERFLRAMELTRKARDMALEVVSGTAAVEPIEPSTGTAEPNKISAADLSPLATEGLSAEDQKMIEHALEGTTGQKPLLRR